MSKILFVGGTFDTAGGKPSSVVAKIASYMKDVDLYNGGRYEDLNQILESARLYQYVIWWANVPNDLPKIRDVKEINPKVILVTSKRNDNRKYSFAELINRALLAKANLCVQFSKEYDADYGLHRFSMLLFDPLGNEWYRGYDLQELASVMCSRMEYLSSISRQGTVPCSDAVIDVPDEKEFFEIIKQHADTFHHLINPAKGVTRFLGNSSFRCQRGFPSFRKDDVIFVSRRNVDKRYIDKDAFVPCRMDGDTIYYYGENKPSVDTPIQMRLYQHLPNINYMLHSHVYIDGAPFTKNMVPCGGLQEVEEVLTAIYDKESDFIAINLIGHGSIVMAKNSAQLKNIQYIGRSLPEKL